MQKLVSAMPLLAACWAPPCAAYETDFHYGMTYWLSRTAGLDDAESRHVAIGNENRDQGMLDAKYAVIARLCLLRAKNASVYTHEAHFRAQKAPPAPRPDREVVHTASFAGQGVEDRWPRRARRSGTSSIRLGDALHGWQDTFSHEGEPSAVWPCPKPTRARFDRFGYREFSEHLYADVTYPRPKLCEQTSETTYVFIERFLAERRPELKPPPWSALSSALASSAAHGPRPRRCAGSRTTACPRAARSSRARAWTTARGCFGHCPAWTWSRRPRRLREDV